MARGSGEVLGELRPASERLLARALASRDELAAAVEAAASGWGFSTTVTEARLFHGPAARWLELARSPDLLELRVFSPGRDVHWLGSRGVELVVAGPAEPGGAPMIGGPGWLVRDRRSRLWGEWLRDDLWYEERIPDPLRYEGLAGSRYAFLRYLEYVRGGRVCHVRCLAVEGGEE